MPTQLLYCNKTCPNHGEGGGGVNDLEIYKYWILRSEKKRLGRREKM